MSPVTVPSPLTTGRPPFSAEESRRLDRAMSRGATPVELVALLMDMRGQRTRGFESAEESVLRHELELMHYQVVYPRYIAFRERVDAEYEKRLEPHVRAAIRGIALASLTPEQQPDAWLRLVREIVQDALREIIPELEARKGPGVEAVLEREYYWRLRADYVIAGFEDPVQLLRRIGPREGVSFLGIPVQSGVHEAMADALRTLDADIPVPVKETIRRHLARKRINVKGETVEVPGVILGFQPRRIADSDQLSNHAFGLAIDINPTINPHIKNDKVIGVLKEITAGLPGAPDGYDFGAVLVPPEADDTLDLPLLHARATAASDRVRDWLVEAMMVEAAASFRIAENKKAVAAAKLAVKEARERGAPPEEREVLRQKLKEAEAGLAQAIADEKKNPVLVRLRLLRSVLKDQVNDWAEYGIMNIPLELLIALKTIPCMRWGVEYKHSKDVMHFELMLDVDRGTGAARCAKRR